MDGQPGGLLFSMIDPKTGNTLTNINNYDDIDVFNFAISDAIKRRSKKTCNIIQLIIPKLVITELYLDFLKLKDDVSLFAEGSAYQFVNAISSTLGIDTKQANSFSSFYKDVTQSIDNQRKQVSGVSINEEMSNLVMYQHLYQASSKLINVINEIYNTTINGLGV